jgi:hypothetical protein
MTTVEPSAIDEKKAEENGTTTEEADWSGFFRNFSSGLVFNILIGFVFVGSIGLFFAKSANANIFPTNINMQPYTNVKRDLNLEIIYMNPVKILSYYGLGFWTDPEKFWIQEANFFNPEANINFMDKFFDTWICSLQKKDQSPFWIFETDVLKNMMCMSFFIFSSIFFYMNYLPEWLIMIVFSIFFLGILYTLYAVNFIYGLYVHVTKYIELISYLLFPANKTLILLDYPLIFMYSILYFWGAFYSIIITPAFITLYTLFKALTVNYIVRKKDNKTDEPIQKMNMISFIKNVFYYKKTFIIILTMIKLILSANSYLGTSYMLGVMIAILILIFGMNILVPNEVNDSLFSVLDFNFPSLNQQVPKEGSPIDMCNKEAYKEAINTTNINTNIGISKITNQPLDVLKINQNNPAQVAPTDPNNKMLGGKKEPMKSKQKLYKIKLV